MRTSQLFTKTSKETPGDEVAKNAQLLTRAGYIYKVMAGVYAYTPLGLRVIENIKQIVREEMDAIGGQELIMTSLQRKETWEKTGRWDEKAVDVWFKSHLQDGTEVGFAWSHEETIIEMVQQHLKSYKDLPIMVYQFQTKMRNELRAKSGIMRGREFVMKDLYSCSLSAEQHEKVYQSCIDAYMRVFQRLGIGDETYMTFASGGAFTAFSHEFQTLCEAGEDVVYLHRGKNVAINEEVLNDETLAELGVSRDELEKVKTAETGNIFTFGTQKSEEMGFTYADVDGKEQYVHLGSYGIGITRAMGVIVEKFADERGLVWPEQVAPYRVYLVRLGDEDKVVTAADDLYEQLQQAGIQVLYDDTDRRPGEKFADADLLGIPHRVVVSAKTVEADKYEHKLRLSQDTELLSAAELKKRLTL